MGFRWVPGKGVDNAALERMRASAVKPTEPMGEAWFLGEREFFPELLGDLDALSAEFLTRPLEEIACGYSSFGPRDEWRDWHDYLLPQLIPRAMEGLLVPLIEYLCTAFMARHPHRHIDGPYPEYLSDLLATLGCCLVERHNWQDGRLIVGTILHKSNRNRARIWGWSDPSGDFSASMFLCLKYLEPEDMEGWVNSIFDIDDPHWRAQLLAWFYGVRKFFAGEVDFPMGLWGLQSAPTVDWAWSHALSSRQGNERVLDRFVDDENLAAFARAALDCLAGRHIGTWEASIRSVDYLHAEIGWLTDGFRDHSLPEVQAILRGVGT